jgi:hypothetical protein
VEDIVKIVSLVLSFVSIFVLVSCSDGSSGGGKKSLSDLFEFGPTASESTREVAAELKNTPYSLDSADLDELLKEGVINQEEYAELSGLVNQQ